MLVLLTGAKGFIGSHLLARLCEAGHTVRIISRTDCSNSTQFKRFIGVEVVTADLTSADVDFDVLLSGCSVVFNCAGEVRDPKLMHALHVDSTRRMIKAANSIATKEHPIHFVQLSSVGAYGAGNGDIRVVDELTMEKPVGVYEETKTIADSLVIDGRVNDYYSYTILRPSNVFGEKMSNNSLRQLGRIIQKGFFFYVGDSRKTAIATYVHVDDVVTALMLCGFDVRSKFEVFNISNDCAFSEMINGMADVLCVRRPRLSLPKWPISFLIRIANKVFRLPVTQERINAMVAKTSYPTEKLERVLGFSPEKKVPSVIGELFTKIVAYKK